MSTDASALAAAAHLDVDLGPLRSYWHPVASSSDVTDTPRGATLLGEDLVVFRSGDRVGAFADICSHRGTRLSLGHVTSEGCLQCPYHGWEYDVDGRCVFIPSQPRDHQRIPSKAQAVRYLAEERYGLVWVALAEPRLPIPAYPEFADPGFHTWVKFYGPWDASAGRMTENALDLAHLDFVHPGLLGDPADPNATVIPHYETMTEDDAILTTYYTAFPSAETYSPENSVVRYETRVDFPFIFTVRIHSDQGTVALYFATYPIEASRAAFWLFESRNYALDEADDRFIAFNDVLESQDRRVVEAQRPAFLSSDLTAGLHLHGPDAGAIEYLRLLKRRGIGHA